MAAIYPGSVRIFSTKVDLVDTVMASHVNLLQDEVTAIETTLGTGILTSSWSGTFSTSTTHASASARMANLEAGLKSATGVHNLNGSVVGTSDAQTLTNKTIDAGDNTITGLTASDVSGVAALTGATFTGEVDVVSATAPGSSSARQIFISTADPSGGADGDVWIKYIA